MPIRPTAARRNTVLAASAAAAAITLISGCGTGSSGSSASGSGGGQTLTLALTQGSFLNYNPWAESNGINGTLWNNEALYDSLTRLNAKGQAVPSVATSWKISGKTVTLQLRSGIKFSDGTPLNAAAVKANLDYGATHPSGAECNAYIAGMQTKVLSPTSVQLTLPKPIPGLLQDFAQCAGFIVSPKALASPAGLTATPDGSGPYTLDKSGTIAGQKYTYVRRAGYWDAKAFPFAQIVVTVFTSSTAADNAARSGQEELIQQLDPKDTSSGLSIVATAPDEYRGFYITDVSGAVSKPLGNLKVRQAMNYAVNRQAIATALFGTYAAVAGSSPFNAAYLGSSPAVNATYPYDVAKARQLMQAAGYGKGFTVPVLVDPGDQQLGEAIAGYEQKIGINLKISIHNADYITQMFTGKWPMVLGNYTLNPAELQTLTGIIGPDGFWNPRHNASPAFASLLAKIQAAPTTATQQPLYAQLAKLVATQAWTVNPVFVATSSGYDKSKLVVKPIAGVPVPMIYNMTPAG